MLFIFPPERINDVVYFNPSDTEWPIAFNVIEKVPLELRHLVVAGLMGVFKKIWPDVWSSRMEYILNNTLLALLEYPQATILGVNRMLADKDFRGEVLNCVTDVVIKAFWQKEFNRYFDRYATEATNLSKGLIGEDNSMLLGALLVTKLQLAAMSRVEVREEEREDFYLYIDEFQNFSTESFANIFAEARKYRLDLILAHQYVAQLNEKVRDSIFGNVGTLVSFRTGPEDAEFLEKYFFPDFNQEDLINLPNYNFYIKLMIDGFLSKGFSAINIPPASLPEKSYLQEIIQHSRQLYSVSRKEVEDTIAHWSFLDFTPSSPSGAKEKGKAKEGWAAVCSRCGKKIIVPFRPLPGRPVYCKDCLAIIREKNKLSPSSRSRTVTHSSRPSSVDSSKIQATIKNIFKRKIDDKQ